MYFNWDAFAVNNAISSIPWAIVFFVAYRFASIDFSYMWNGRNHMSRKKFEITRLKGSLYQNKSQKYIYCARDLFWLRKPFNTVLDQPAGKWWKFQNNRFNKLQYIQLDHSHYRAQSMQLPFYLCNVPLKFHIFYASTKARDTLSLLHHFSLRNYTCKCLFHRSVFGQRQMKLLN